MMRRNFPVPHELGPGLNPAVLATEFAAIATWVPTESLAKNATRQLICMIILSFHFF